MNSWISFYPGHPNPTVGYGNNELENVFPVEITSC